MPRATSSAPPPPIPDPPDPCRALIDAESMTWIVGAGEAVATRGLQLDWRIGRNEERGADSSRSFIFEQWALITERGVVSATDSDFAEMAQAALLERSDERAEIPTLAVQAPVHPYDKRWIPRPLIGNWRGELDTAVVLAADERSAPGQRNAWFRAEISGKGNVDQLEILEQDAGLDQQMLETLVTTEAAKALVFDDHRRHRVVFFGRLEFSERSKEKIGFRLADGLVILPRCCCGAEFCI